MYIEELVPGTVLEDGKTEFKGMVEEGRKGGAENLETGWLKTLAAFANTHGGNLYIGVENKDHSIVALDRQKTDKCVLMLHHHIKEKLYPGIDYSVEAIPFSGSDVPRFVVKVSVSESCHKPVALKNGGAATVYRRVFGRTETASYEEIRDMFLLSDSVPYDTQFTEKLFRKEDFSKLWSVASARRGSGPSEKELVSIGFMSEEGRLSKGALLFSDEGDGEKTLVSATVWPGFDKGDSRIYASRTFSGNILGTIEESVAFVTQHSANGFIKEGLGRRDFISYPERSLVEAVVNAVAHRNYFMEGSQVEVNVFLDRVEITSPGSLLGVAYLQKERDIASIIPRRRNKVVCSVLAMCCYMEQKGSGFDKIVADYSGYGEIYRPYVTSSPDHFTLALPDLARNGGMVGESRSVNEVYAVPSITDGTALRILAFCYLESRSTGEIAEALGMAYSDYFKKKFVTPLVEEGFLRESRSGRLCLFMSCRDKVFPVDTRRS